MQEPWMADGRSILAGTPALLSGWVAPLPQRLLAGREAPGTFSPAEVVAHLVQAERELWVPRMRSIMEHGESRTFAHFDRFGHLAWIGTRSLDDVLREFSVLRLQSLDAWDGVLADRANLERRGLHPEFGPVTLSQLFATWVVHDLTHVRQIARVLAKQFATAVGPWRAYLTVLHESGSRAATSEGRASAPRPGEPEA